MALTYSISVKTKRDDKNVSKSFNKLNDSIDNESVMNDFATKYAALFDTSTTLVSATVDRKRTWSASND